FFDELAYVLGDAETGAGTTAHHTEHHTPSSENAGLAGVTGGAASTATATGNGTASGATTTTVNLEVDENPESSKQTLDSLFQFLSAPNASTSQAESLMQQSVVGGSATPSSHHYQHHAPHSPHPPPHHPSHRLSSGPGGSASARPFKRTRLQSNHPHTFEVDHTPTLDWLEQERARDRALGEGLKERLDRLLELTERNTMATERMAAALERWVEARENHEMLLSSNDR
ncbi:hypothetical protein SYNPS1DRAFT_31686, partial [Syncephalis pseudoplumigaleata]